MQFFPLLPCVQSLFLRTYRKIHPKWLLPLPTVAASCEELTHLKRPWCWETLKAGGEEDDRGWDGWMASLTQWTWVRVNSGSWWWTGRPGVLQSMGSQRVGHDWAVELNWTEALPNTPGAGWEDLLDFTFADIPISSAQGKDCLRLEGSGVIPGETSLYNCSAGSLAPGWAELASPSQQLGRLALNPGDCSETWVPEQVKFQVKFIFSAAFPQGCWTRETFVQIP